MKPHSAVFDTNILIDYLKGITLESYAAPQAISAITWMEVMVGAKRFGQAPQTRSFLSQFTLLPVNQAVSERTVEVRQKWGIKLPDAIILATAQTHSTPLISRNLKDFNRVPGVVMPYSFT